MLHAASCTLNGSFKGAWRQLNNFNHGQPNHSFNPTALSLLFINIVQLNQVLSLASGGRLIRALAIMTRCVTTADENVIESEYASLGHRRGEGRAILVPVSPCVSLTREPL